MLLYNLKTFIRNLRKNKLFSFLNLAGFSVGFAVCIILSLFIYREFSVDTGFENHKSIYRLIDTISNNSKMDYDIASALKKQYPEISLAAPLNYNALNIPIYLRTINGTDYVLIKEIISSDNDFFKIFTLTVLVGDKENPFPNSNSLVITRSIAQKLFGKTDVLGEIIHLDNAMELPVGAVVEDMPENASMGADIFFNSSNENFRFSQTCNAGVCYNDVNIYVLINKITDLISFQKKLNSAFPANKSKTTGISLQPLQDIYLAQGIKNSDNKAGSKGLIYIFLSIALLILSLSVINYVNFTLSKHLSALKVIGIKITNGANNSQLRQYYLTEIVMSVIISFLIALYIASAALPVAEKLLDTSLDLRWLFSWQVIVMFCFAVIIMIMVSILAPGYIIRHFDVQMLFGKKGLMPGRRLGQKILTVFQIFVSLILLISLILIQKQLTYIKTADLGFNKELLLNLNISDDFQNKTALKQQVDNLSFVKSSSYSQGSPGFVRVGMSVPDLEQSNFNCFYVDRQFLETFHIELLEGREFMDGDLNQSCYINEEAYKRYSWENLENRTFKNGKDGGYKVVGVVKDFNMASLHKGIEPACLIFTDRQYSSLNIRLLPGNISEHMNTLQSVWRSMVPGTQFSYVFFDEYFDSLYRREDRQGKAIALFSVIAFIITLLGMLGQILQVTINRTKEIGIRRINGAKVADVMTMLNKEFIAGVIVAFLIAAPVSYFLMSKWLENFAYKTNFNWWIFVLSGLFTLLVTLMAVSYQSWRAATRNPVEALRYE